MVRAMVSRFRSLVIYVAMGVFGFIYTAVWAQGEPAMQIAYHYSEGLEQAVNGLRNMGNHLEVDPKAKLVAVTHARGVDFLMEGAKTTGGYPFELLVQELRAKGVRFQVCEITLRNRKLRKDQFIAEVEFVASGVVQLARLQRDGHAYIKP
jgi:uncharacterized protein